MESTPTPRRGFLGALLAIAFLLVLAGCFGSKESGPEPTTSPSSEPDTGADYAEGVYAYADAVATGAGANEVAEVNPYGYQNPWGA